MKNKTLFLIAMSFLIFGKGVDAKMIRKPAVADMFYPGEKQELIKMIDGFLAKANPPKIEGSLLGLISPHAGYVYSGPVAGYSYKVLQDKKYKTVIIFAASHNMPFSYGALYYSEGGDNYFQTPLGDVRINNEISERLLKNKDIFRADERPHIPEHSIEVQIPFLQRVLKPGFEIVPILFGTQGYKILESAASAVYEAVKNEDVLLIASTDFSHYYDYKTAQKMDKIGIGLISSLNPSALSEQDMIGATQLCGLSGVIVEMLISKKSGANNVQVLNVANSGDVPFGDKGRVVGYAAIAITKK